MKPITYKIWGVIIFILSFIYLLFITFDLFGGENFFADGFWFLFLSLIIVVFSGILYFLYGIGKLTINKLSDKSLWLLILALIIGFGGFFLIWLIIILFELDSMGLIFGGLLLMLGGLISIIAFILLLVSIFKKKSLQPQLLNKFLFIK